MYDRLADFFNTHNLFNPSQFEFRKNLNTMDVTYRVFHEALETLHARDRLMAVCCELATSQRLLIESTTQYYWKNWKSMALGGHL